MDLTGLSFKAQRLIELRRTEHERAFGAALRELDPDGRGISLPRHLRDALSPLQRAYVSSGEDPREAAALTFVLSSFRDIVTIVLDDVILPAQVPAIVDRVWCDLLTETYRDKHPHQVGDEGQFMADAAQARLTQSWWEQHHAELETRLKNPPTFGQQLRAAMERMDWTVADIVRLTEGKVGTRETGFDRKTVEAHLAGATPHPDTVRVYERLFAAHGYPIRFELPPGKSRHS